MSGLFSLLLTVNVSAQTRTFRPPNLERKETQLFPIQPGVAVGDPLLLSLGNPQTRERALQTYRDRGAEAVPGLKAHLQSTQPGIRMLALSALQVAWAPGTEQAVFPFLKSPVDAEAKAAWHLLKQKIPDEDLERWGMANLFELNPDRVQVLLRNVESEKPDPARMLDLLSRDPFWKALLPLLPRYTAEEFKPFTRYIASQARGEWLAWGLASLIQQGDRDPSVVKQMESWIRDSDPRVREMAAEYYRWHGGADHLPVLEQALEAETDLFAKATLEESRRILSQREPAPFPEPLRPMEPAVNYAVDLVASDPAAVKTRAATLRKALGYSNERPRVSAGELPWVLVPPVREFPVDNRSYGKRVEEGEGPFAGKVHVARDVAWGKDMTSVLAIAPGTVKRVQVARESWGGLVVIEHRSPTGKIFCSLYGHLGPLITVQKGDVIPAGTKLGGLGRSYTAENGGYLSHLHFSIYNGPYGFGRWVTGYMDAEDFEQGDHKWLDPYTLYRQ